MAADKTDRRGLREGAVRSFNDLAVAVGLEAILVRAGPPVVQKLYKDLCQKVDAEQLLVLRASGKAWVENGGAELCESALKAAEKRTSGDDACEEERVEAGRVPGHTISAQSFYGSAKGAFRLRSRAFMLTYNSLLFTDSPQLWNDFVEFVKQCADLYKASYWSCTMARVCL